MPARRAERRAARAPGTAAAAAGFRHRRVVTGRRRLLSWTLWTARSSRPKRTEADLRLPTLAAPTSLVSRRGHYAGRPAGGSPARSTSISEESTIAVTARVRSVLRRGRRRLHPALDARLFRLARRVRHAQPSL